MWTDIELNGKRKTEQYWGYRKSDMDKEIDRGCKSGIVQQGASWWRPSDTGKIGGISYKSSAVCQYDFRYTRI